MCMIALSIWLSWESGLSIGFRMMLASSVRCLIGTRACMSSCMVVALTLSPGMPVRG